VPVRRLQFVPAPLEAMTGHLAGLLSRWLSAAMRASLKTWPEHET